MADDVRLVSPDRRALMVVEQLEESGVAELFLLTGPDGEVELRETARHEIVAFGYTTLAALFTSCGSGQPRRRSTVADLARLADEFAATVLFAVDVWHPAGTRYPDPDVRDAEPLPLADYLPPITEVWLPTLPVAPGAKSAGVQLFCEPPDGPKLFAYPSLDELRRCCGPYQAAVWVRPERLDEVAKQAGADGVVFGAVLTDELRHQAPVVDWRAHAIFE